MEKSEQNLVKSLTQYWTCQYCGEDTSKELKSELCETDHWDCIMNECIVYDKKLNDEQ